jgi:hypothetical protein
MSEPAVVDGSAEELGTEVATVESHPANLFNTNDPVEVLDRASRVAQALKNVITQQGLVSNIQGREHVRVEGWTTLGAMIGVNPVVVWTRELADGWEARVEARTLDGRVVGAAEAMCTKAERTWASRDAYALRSMAQTRATSKALRGPLGFVVTLAGYEATPAEEMPAEASSGPSGPVSDTAPATPAQLRYLKSLVTQHKPPVATLTAMLEAVDAHGVDPSQEGWSKALKRDQASRLIEVFKSGRVPAPGQQDIPTDTPPPLVVEPGDDIPFDVTEPAA